MATEDEDGFESFDDNPELISQMNYRGVMIRLIQSDLGDEVKIVKNPGADGYTIAAPQALVEKLAGRNNLAVFTGAVTLSVMLIINQELDG